MRVLSAGGGSGGHVTPVLAVLNALKELEPQLEAVFVCDRAFEAQSRGLMSHAAASVKVETIAAGKFRRYHGISWQKQLLDLPTIFHNVIDGFKIIGGFFQSLWLIARFRPDVVFAKGGYVCLPVGAAARLLRVPLVIHDSDSRPGLTNRVLAGWADRIATGTPLENYSYSPSISAYTGVPVDPAFHPFDATEQAAAKAEIGLVDLTKPLIVVTGGGLGAQSINRAVQKIAPELLENGAALYHVTGKQHFDALQRRAPAHVDYHLVPFVYKDMARLLGAADVVVTRGSATFLQELAGLKKPAVIIPAPHLGDQLKNAEVYRSAEAAIVLDDKAVVNDPDLLLREVIGLIEQPERAAQLAKRLHQFSRPKAAHDVARIVLEAAK